jgi:cell division protein FtsB
MPEELYTSRDFCELAEQFEELKRENEELVSDKMHLINAAMDGVDKYRYTAHDIAYRDLERKCEALEADYVISNRELLIKQVEINRQSARIAELEEEIDQLTSHSNIERQDDKSPNDTQTQTIVYGKEREE